jgi:hypothetical protein
MNDNTRHVGAVGREVSAEAPGSAFWPEETRLQTPQTRAVPVGPNEEYLRWMAQSSFPGLDDAGGQAAPPPKAPKAERLQHGTTRPS